MTEDVTTDVGRDVEEIEKAREAMEEDEWIDLLGSSELFRKVVEVGDSECRRPEKDNIVTVRLKGNVAESGLTIECQDDLRFQLGQDEVVQAVELCVQAMAVGETDLIKTTSRFAYGSAGRGSDVPSNASIVYELTLVKVEDGPDIYSMSREHRLFLCEKRKDRGNYFFERKEYLQAIQVYKRVLSLLDVDIDNDYESLKQEEIDRIHKLAADSWNNLGAAQLKTDCYTDALVSLGRCLERSPDNVKALFRCGKAHAGLGDMDKALLSLKKASNIDPESVLIQKELTRIEDRRRKNLRAEKRMYSRMFQRKADDISSSKSGWGIGVKLAAASLITTGIAVGLYYVL